jgi:Transcription initiation factor TFIIIB, Brf1 subunit/Transcription initiation factor TFIIB
VCTQCGLVVDSVADTGPEWRVCGASQLARIRAAPLRLVSRTEIGVKAGHGTRWLALAGFNRDTLHGKERRLASIGAEMSRVRECAGAPHRVAEAAMALVRRHVYDLEGLSAGAVAVAALWLASRDLGGPRPLSDFLRCSKADKSAVKRAAWRLDELVRGRRPPIEDYVRIVAARARLPAPVVRRALEILAGNRRVAAGRNPWVLAAASLWLATYKEYGMLIRLAEAAGVTIVGVKNAARRMRV